jgi:hypothetical protein
MMPPMSGKPEVRLAHASLEALAQDHEENLSKGRAFVAGAAGVAQREVCDLVVVHPENGHELRLAAEVVFLAEGVGMGLELSPFDEAVRTRMKEFLAEKAEEAPARPETLHERIRNLSVAEQQRLARGGTPSERIALEHAYGPTVWESLLINPRITIPEVAKIAKKGMLPKPLIENIVGHAAWLQAPEVQRSLLSNPRLGSGAMMTKVLRALSKPELQRAALQITYPMAVRDAAKRMLKGED